MTNSAVLSVCVTGGAGYVGAVLVPKLLAAGHRVTVLDWFLYGDDVLASVAQHPHLTKIVGDIRDETLLRRVLPEHDVVIHLACISNDPSFELNPDLGRAVNYEAFEPLVRMARECGVRRFVYASSSSVYGVKAEENVVEEMSLEPLTDYSRYKALCEDILLQQQRDDFVALILRPATVCGYSPRLRLDLTVNILTTHALTKGVITVFGGAQKRPNIHIDDMSDVYVRAMQWSDASIAGKIYNVGYHNHTVREIADIVRGVVSPDVEIVTHATNDLRSYHVSSGKIAREHDFTAHRSIENAAQDLVAAFRAGKIRDPLTNPKYYNIKMMQQAGMV